MHQMSTASRLRKRVWNLQTTSRVGRIHLRLLDPIFPLNLRILVLVHRTGRGDPEPPRRGVNRRSGGESLIVFGGTHAPCAGEKPAICA